MISSVAPVVCIAANVPILVVQSKGFLFDGYLGRNNWFRRVGFVPHRGHGLVHLNATSRGLAPIPPRLAPDWAAYWIFNKVSERNATCSSRRVPEGVGVGGGIFSFIRGFPLV